MENIEHLNGRPQSEPHNEQPNEGSSTASEETSASSELPPQCPRRRRSTSRHPRVGDYASRQREMGLVARHRNGVHRRRERTVICEIADPLPVSPREVSLLFRLLGEAINQILS